MEQQNGLHILSGDEQASWLRAAPAAGEPEPVADSYTPFGYLQNPFHVAHDYGHTYGGNVRTPAALVGCGWVYPTERVAQSEISFGIGLQLPDRLTLLRRPDFAQWDYDSRYHSMSILGYHLELPVDTLPPVSHRSSPCPSPRTTLTLDNRYFLADENTLVGLLLLVNSSSQPQRLRVYLLAQARSRSGNASARWVRTGEDQGTTALLLQTEQTAPHEVRWVAVNQADHSVDPVMGLPSLFGDPADLCRLAAAEAAPSKSAARSAARSSARSAARSAARLPGLSQPDAAGGSEAWGVLPLDVTVPVQDEPLLLVFSLRRHTGVVWQQAAGTSPSSSDGTPHGEPTSSRRQAADTLHPPQSPLTPLHAADLQRWLDSYQRQLASDAAFRQSTPALAGDWPAAWRHSFVYDWETTRLCILPPGGIFRGPWPTWMQAYPRAVLAEGTLDAARLSCAAPELAKEALLSLFRDTPGPNVPCVHQGGEFNMVADDGSCCGTSPAWCLPLYNVYLVYLRTLDTEWVKQLYPHLVAYVEWWLAHRTDEDGWLVYKCTWEAGEDNTPRLDPEQTGSNVVSGIVRPVELQAAMAQSARILATFARVCGEPATTVNRWLRLAREFTAKTRALWDADSARFRDIDKRTGRFLVWTPPAGRVSDGQKGPEQGAAAPADYWGTNPLRFSALSLTPLVMNIATPEQVEDFAAEMPYYAREPWTIWPSWAYVVHEAWLWAGFRRLAADTAYSIVDRVYRENDRRTLVEAARPLPGVAREYWPTDLKAFRGSDAYGWGATTASLLIRQVFGFWESEATDRWEFRLSLCLPEPLNEPGRRYTIRRLYYRGVRLALTLAVAQPQVQAQPADLPPVWFEIELSRQPASVMVLPDCPSPAPLTGTPGETPSPVLTSGQNRWLLQQGQSYHVVVTW